MTSKEPGQLINIALLAQEINAVSQSRLQRLILKLWKPFSPSVTSSRHRRPTVRPAADRRLELGHVHAI